MTPTPRPNPSGRRRPTGFSMIEILAVIAILAILGSLLYVALRQVGRSTKVNATRTMMENLRGMLAELDATTKLTGFPDGTLNAPGDVTDEQSVNDRTGDQCLFTRVIIAKLTALPNNKTALGKLPPERLMTWAIVPATPPPWGNGTTYTPGMRVRTTPPDRDWVCIREHTSATANDEPGSGANYTQYWTPQPAAVATTPVILDAWSNPILFVPGGGLADVLTTEAPAYDPGTPYAKSQVVRHTPSAPAGAKEQSFRALRSTTGDEPGVAGSEDDWAPAARSPDKRPFFASAGEDGDFSKGDDNLYSFEN